MNLLFRFIKTILLGLLSREEKRHVLDPSVMTMRVWPTDLDLNFHMNNGRYLSIMDLGRTDMMVRSGMLKPVLKNGWMPVIAAANMRYRRSLEPLQKYLLKSRLVCWDEKWVFIEQTFETMDGKTAAVGVVKATILTKKGTLPTADLIAALGHEDLQSPPMPQDIAVWMAAEQGLARRAVAA
ncbi:MAG: thioesterase family protein [Alphaproteobacteria bacterium]